MKKIVLLGLCIFLLSCSKNVEVEKTESIYQKVIADKLEAEPFPLWMLFYSSSNGEEMRKKVVDSKVIETLLTSIKQFNYSSESDEECINNEGVKIYYEEGRYANITFSKTCSSTNLFNKNPTFEDFDDYQELVKDVKSKEFRFSTNFIKISGMLDTKTKLERILADCVGKTCNEYTEKGKDEHLLKNFLYDLNIKDETEKPESGNTFIFEFSPMTGSETLQLTFYEDDKEMVLGFDEVYYDVDTTYLSVRELLAMLEKNEVENPSLSGSTEFKDGVGYQLEQAGFTYENNSFTSSPYNMEKVVVDIDKGIISFGKDAISFDFLKNISDTSSIHGSVCRYSLSAQASIDCSIEDAKEEYQQVLDKIAEFTQLTNCSMEDLKTLTIEQRNIEKIKADELGKVDIEKIWMGNVVDVGAMMQADGFVYQDSTLTKNIDNQVITFNPNNYSFFYGTNQEGSTYMINSSIGQYEQDGKVCDFDYNTDTVIGEQCEKEGKYYFEEINADAQRMYYSLLNRYSLTNDEVILYSQMIQSRN